MSSDGGWSGSSGGGGSGSGTQGSGGSGASGGSAGGGWGGSSGGSSGSSGGGGGGWGGAGGGGGGGGWGGGGGGGPGGAQFAKYAARTEGNMNQMKYYAAALCGLMAVFVLFHLSRVGARKFGIANKSIFSPFHSVSRVARRALIPKFPGLPSRGHAVLTVLFVGINVIIMFTNMDNKSLKIHSNMASRTGWMAVSNMVVVVFLSLKNTPLAIFSAWSYERLQVLHQIAGYTTVGCVIIHASTYASYFGQMGNFRKLRAEEEIFGYVAGFSFLIMVFAAGVIRRWWYELFYVIHIFFFLAVVVFVGLHQPEMASRIAIVTCIAGGLWAADRLFRMARVAYYSVNNDVTVDPLPSGGTRLRLRKSPKSFPGGSHCFLWIPKIRALEMHPFTLVGDEEHEFVVACYDGFTRDLRRYAEAHPGARLRASIEGPYGKMPDPHMFDRVVMVAGGSGGSFTFGTAISMVRRWKEGKPIAFHWMIKDRSYIGWFAKFLKTLNATGKVSINLHITQNSSPPATPPEAGGGISSDDAEKRQPRSSSGTTEDAALPEDPEKAMVSPISPVTHSHHEHATATRCSGGGGCSGGEAHEICTMASSSTSSTSNNNNNLHILQGRPDVATLIREEVAKASPGQRVLVLGCGPKGLMRDVRDAAAGCIRRDGPGVELHTEQFGW